MGSAGGLRLSVMGGARGFEILLVLLVLELLLLLLCDDFPKPRAAQMPSRFRRSVLEFARRRRVLKRPDCFCSCCCCCCWLYGVKSPRDGLRPKGLLRKTPLVSFTPPVSCPLFPLRPKLNAARRADSSSAKGTSPKDGKAPVPPALEAAGPELVPGRRGGAVRWLRGMVEPKRVEALFKLLLRLVLVVVEVAVDEDDGVFVEFVVVVALGPLLLLAGGFETSPPLSSRLLFLRMLLLLLLLLDRLGVWAVATGAWACMVQQVAGGWAPLAAAGARCRRPYNLRMTPCSRNLPTFDDDDVLFVFFFRTRMASSHE